MNKKIKVWKDTAEKIKCKYTGVSMLNADSKKQNSRQFKKDKNGNYIHLSYESLLAYASERLSEETYEHDGTNLDKDGQPLDHEKWNDMLARLRDKDRAKNE